MLSDCWRVAALCSASLASSIERDVMGFDDPSCIDRSTTLAALISYLGFIASHNESEWMPATREIIGVLEQINIGEAVACRLTLQQILMREASK